MNSHERMQRESNLVAIIRKKLPEFAKACADDTELVLIHQDAFAADYQEDEYALLGMAIKDAARRRENPVTESLQKQVAHPNPHLCSRDRLTRLVGFAREF